MIVTGGDFVDVFAPAYTTFNVSYNLKDTAGNPAKPVYRTVVIQDSTKPILYLRGMILSFVCWLLLSFPRSQRAIP